MTIPPFLARWLRKPKHNPGRDLAMIGVNKRRLKYVRFHADMADKAGTAIPESWRKLLAQQERRT